MPDEQAARRTGRTLQAVQCRRVALDIDGYFRKRLRKSGLLTCHCCCAAGYTLPGVPAGKGNVIQLHDIKGRIARLQQLSMGLATEAAAWKGGEDPLLYLERKQYLNAMLNALAGLEEACVVLAGVVGRLEKGRS